MKKRLGLGLAVFITMVCFGPFAYANETQLLSMIQDLQKQMTQMQQTIETQNMKIHALESGEKMRYIPAGDVAAPAEAENAWLKDLKFSSDLRLRYEAQQEHGATNTPDRNRFRYRLRFGFEKGFDGPFHEDDKMKVGFRLASQPVGGVTSTNTTLDTNFDFDAISINRAYASYFPGWAKYTTEDGIGLTGMHVTAGKFKNPYTLGSTWTIWDGDVEPEGLYEQLNFSLFKSEDLTVDNTTTVGQLILEEGGAVDHDDAELYAYQTVFESKINGIMDKPIKVKNAFSFYDYKDFSLPGNFLAAGNNNTSLTTAGALATSFAVINVYNEIGLPVDVHKAKGLKLYVDWLENVAGSGLDAENGDDDKAWMIGTKLGNAKKKGSWSLKYEYAWVEANATPDVFSDGDFGVSTTPGGVVIGGTNTRGSIIEGAYALSDYLTVSLKTFYTNSIAGSDDSERDLYQLNLIWKF